MASTVEMSASWGVLSDMMDRIRHRWRLRLALHGVMIVLGAALFALLAGSWSMWLFHFDDRAIAVVRIVTYVALAVLVVRYVVLPLRRSASDTQVALYLEEHEPSLDAVVISAVEAGTSDAPAFMRSPGLVTRLVDMAAARVSGLRDSVQIEGRSIRTSLLALLGIMVVGTLMIGKGPSFLRTGARLLAAPGTKANVFVSVQPGNASVNRGGDQTIRAVLHGFDADRSELVMQRGSGPWEHLPMTAIRDSSAFVIRLFAIKERVTYYVNADGFRSPTYYLNMVDLPFVKRLSLEYHYPSYTGLATKVVNGNGDISAPEGTKVVISTTTTVPVLGGRIAIAGVTPIGMTLGTSGVLSGTIEVRAPGFYKLEFAGSNGVYAPGSLGYIIDIHKDQKPTVKFVKPGNDVTRTPSEDVETQIKATDDYGISKLDIRYRVNGDPEHVVQLPVRAPSRQVIDGYTLVLKQLKLSPGDVVSYYAEATDNDAVNGGKSVKSDMYFVRLVLVHDVHSFVRNLKRARPPNNGGGTFVERERAIIVGTSDIDRAGSDMPAATRKENLTGLTLAQRKLREDVDSEMVRIRVRLLQTDPRWQSVIDEDKKATDMMQAAEDMLAVPNEGAAVGSELNALQHLQKAEEAFKKMVPKKKKKNAKSDKDSDGGDHSQADGGNRQLGGGGGPKEANEGDLEHLFDPSQDQLGQQFETSRSLSRLPVDSVSRPVIGDINDAPSDFQTLISEYYRSLAKQP